MNAAPPELFAKLRILGPFNSFARTGSREICTPAPSDTDEGWICLVHSFATAATLLEAEGFVTSSDPNYQGMKSPFQSWRRGEINLLITEEPDFFAAFIAATFVARRLNLIDKSDRIALFRAVLYREICQPRAAA